MKPAPFKSTFALLEVKQGRQALFKKVEAGGKVRVRVEMIIDHVWGSDDGISREFSCDVLSVKEYRAKK